METESRHHHYIPQGYLRGFGFKRGKTWLVIVNDFMQKKMFETSTRNVCGERDFMRFEMPDRKPDWLEEEFSKLEGKACEAIRNVVKTGGFDGDNKNYILNLMALLAVRSPEQRENMRDFHARVAKMVMALTLETKERWESQTENLQEKTGKKCTTTYEQAKEFHERGEYKIEVARERHIQTEIKLFNEVLQMLGRRKWTLYTAAEDQGDFITTNRPVVIIYINPDKVPEYLRHSPGFALTETEVYFPLTTRALLVGRWDKGDETVIAAQPFVGVVNNQMIHHCSGQVFSPTRKILYHDPLMRLKYDEKVIERFTVAPSKEELDQFMAEHEHLVPHKAGPNP